MPDPGRTTESRVVTGVTTSNVAATLTAAAGSFNQGDVGRTVTGTGVPAGRTILSVNAAGTVATMNGNGNAVGTNSVTLGPDVGGQASGFIGWSPETAAEAVVNTVASRNAGATDHNRPTAGNRLSLQRSRS